MASMSSYSIGVSGIRNAQSGLSTTGHNMANSGVAGYSRQGNIQQTFLYRPYRESKVGLLQIGMGTDLSEIRQIRNKFFDAEYRDEASTANYYSAKYMTGQEVENILGELESSYAAQDVISNIWEGLNELSIYPDGIETRGSFIETCVTFLDKMNDIQDGLYNYQINLNEQIKTTVGKINDIVTKIDELNDKIIYNEMSGDNANDFRDSRNILLDELSSYLDITVKDNANGRADILVEGKELLVNGVVNKIGLKYSTPGYAFVEPVFTQSETILPENADVVSIFGDLSTQELSGGSENCGGLLKGMLVSRGNTVGRYNSPDNETSNFLIPSVQKDFDNLVNGIVNLLNDSFASGDTFDLTGGHGVPIFTKIVASDDYTTTNLEINPILRDTDGYNYLALSASGAVRDTTAILEVMKKWENGVDGLEDAFGNPYSVNNYYRSIVDNVSNEVNEASKYYDQHEGLLTSVDNKRQTLSGVSLDEELSYMLKYQYAFQASSKFINIIDSMVDKVVNGMGVVGR